MTVDPRFWNSSPRRRLAWTQDARGRAVLLRPKLGEGRLGRWLSARMRRPHYRIRLDEIGTLVWKSCDGQTPLGEVLEQMRQHFGPSVEPAEDRLYQFLREMYRARLIEF